MTKKATYFRACKDVVIGAALSLSGEQIATYKAKASLNAADFEIITGCGIGIYDDFIVTQAGVLPKVLPDDMLAILNKDAREQALKLLGCRLNFPCSLLQLCEFVAAAEWPEVLPDGYDELVGQMRKPVGPIQRQAFQEREILKVITLIGHDPLALPIGNRGKPGVKNAVRTKSTGMSPRVFDKAWQRLRDQGAIKDTK
ncbi:MAG: hypothetical protein Q8M20_04555 [Rhodocyclaceae bacterium]|nr:hypothetical protein [Rhodocyclaceae bacterium]MDZ4214030.1 hypothetical protein [Rhodocyclaceae bacterium]